MRSGLLLDLDGTLADSLGVMRAVFGRFISAHGRGDRDTEFERFNGPPLKRIVTQLRDELGLDQSVEDLLAEYCGLLDEAYADVPPSPDVRALLETAKSAGWRIAVVTSNDRRRTQSWLDNTGLNHLIDQMVCGEDIRLGKPDPEPYLRASQIIDVPPAMSVAVEDSAQGAQAAVAAGILTFGYQPCRRSTPAWPVGVTPFGSFTDLRRTLFGF